MSASRPRSNSAISQLSHLLNLGSILSRTVQSGYRVALKIRSIGARDVATVSRIVQLITFTREIWAIKQFGVHRLYAAYAWSRGRARSTLRIPSAHRTTWGSLSPWKNASLTLPEHGPIDVHSAVQGKPQTLSLVASSTHCSRYARTNWVRIALNKIRCIVPKSQEPFPQRRKREFRGVSKWIP